MLSLLLPGLGQAWLGSLRRGLLLALPVLLAFGLIVVLVVVNPTAILGALVEPGVIIGLLVVVLGLAVWHLNAINDTYRVALRRRPGQPVAWHGRISPRRSPLLALAVVTAIGVYGGVELLGLRAFQATSAIFAQPSGGLEIPKASFEPEETAPGGSLGPTGSPPPTAPPGPTPTPGPAWAQDGRLNLLLIGSDAGPGRWLARTDTMVVLSVDVASGRAAMFGIPRNIVNVPLPPESAGAFAGGRYPAMLNSLFVYAVQNPALFPGDTEDARGFRAVSGAIQELVGVPLDGAVVINLNGFVDLVDAIDGLWIDIPYAIYDPRYPLPNGSGYREIYIEAGCRHLNGERALEYARTRHQDSDYGRMRRQQNVLLALARQVDPIGLLPRAPELLDVAANNLWTTIQPNDMANLAVLAASVDTADIQSIQLSPPTYAEYLQTDDIKRIRKLVRHIFDAPAEASPSPSPTAVARPCPRK